MQLPDRQRAAEALYYSLILCYCLLFFRQDAVYLQDYPAWVYSGYVLGLKLQAIPTPHYFIAAYPVPNSFLTVFIALGSLLLDTFLVSKLLVMLYLFFFAWTILQITKQMHPNQYVYRSLLLMSTVIISSSFWNGYLNFQLGLLFFAVYYLLKLRKLDTTLVTLLMSLLIFFCHATVFAVFFAYVCYRYISLKKVDGRVYALAPSLLLSLWYIYSVVFPSQEVTRMVLNSPVSGGLVSHVLYKAYTFLKAGPFQNFILPGGSSYLESVSSLYYVFIGMSALFLLTLMSGIAFRIYRAVKGKRIIDRDMLFFSLVFLSYLVFPAVMLQVVNIGERFMVTGLMMLVICLPLKHRLVKMLSVISLIFLVYNLVFLAGSDNLVGHRESAAVAEVLGERRLSESFRSMYTHTKHKYLNHRLYVGADYYEAIRQKDFSKGTFPTGVIAYEK